MKKILVKLLCASLSALSLNFVNAVPKSYRVGKGITNNFFVGKRGRGANKAKLLGRPKKRSDYAKSQVIGMGKINHAYQKNVQNVVNCVSEHGGVSHFKKLANGNIELICVDGAIFVVSSVVFTSVVIYFCKPENAIKKTKKAFSMFNEEPNRKNAYAYLNSLKKVVCVKYRFSNFFPGAVLDELYDSCSCEEEKFIELIRELAKAILTDGKFEVTTDNVGEFWNLPGADKSWKHIKGLLAGKASGRESKDEYLLKLVKMYAGKYILDLFKNNRDAFLNWVVQFAITEYDCSFEVLNRDDNCDWLRCKGVKESKEGSYIVDYKRYDKRLNIKKHVVHKCEPGESYGTYCFDSWYVNSIKSSEYARRWYVYNASQGSWMSYIFNVVIALMYFDKW